MASRLLRDAQRLGLGRKPSILPGGAFTALYGSQVRWSAVREAHGPRK